MSLSTLVHEAIQRRHAALAQWHAEDTDCYRLFSGTVEGFPGLDIDRLGPILLVQTWKYPLDPGELEELTETCSEALGIILRPCWNHHSRPLDFARWHRPLIPAISIGRELGITYTVQPRHEQPWPLLDSQLRPARRWLQQHSRGCSVLSLFSGSCTFGTVSAASGAAEVWNVDRSGTSLAWGKKNANLNQIGRAKIRWVDSECVPAIRQLAGLNVQLRDGKFIDFPQLNAKRFDRVILHPPQGSTGPFGTIDLSKDIKEWFKPALKCVRPGGNLLLIHSGAETTREDLLRHMIHWAEQLGRSIDFEVLHPEADHPNHEGLEPALKMILVEPR